MRLAIARIVSAPCSTTVAGAAFTTFMQHEPLIGCTKDYRVASMTNAVLLVKISRSMLDSGIPSLRYDRQEKESLMDATRRGFLMASGGAAANELSQAQQHDHEHDHGHQDVPSDPTLRVKALESLLVEKGLVDPAALDALIDTYEHKVGPRNGARVVAKAWVDPAYKTRLLADATNAIAELGYGGRQGEHMVVVENTPKVHNLVVCTLCSCYPWSVLGLPPVWYKSAPYRSRAVIDPRGVLHEFGVDVTEDTEVRVWDSTAELRYLVLPERPAGTEKMSEEQLAALVTRDAMVGVGKVKA